MGVINGKELSKILKLSKQSKTKIRSGGILSAKEVLLGLVVNSIDRVTDTSIKTGMPTFDSLTRFSPKEMCVIGALPSMGKTDLALQWMLNMSQDKRVLFLSYETGVENLGERLLAMYLEYSYDAIQEDMLELGVEKIEKLLAEFESLDFSILEATGMGIKQIIDNVEDYAPEVLILDHIGLVPSDKSNRYEMMTEVSIALKSLAVNQKILVIVLSQLSEDPAKDCSLNILRDTRQIGFDSDVVVYLWEPPENADCNRILTIAKNKRKNKVHIRMNFQGDIQKFFEV